MVIAFFQRRVARDRHTCAERCNDWAGLRVAKLRPQSLLDVGCGDGSLLFRYLDYKPALFCGIEVVPELKSAAEARGLKVDAVDLNGPWPYPDHTFEVIHAAQVIEHLHNTRLFLEEMRRVLKPGGTALITSENLTSFLNLGAMALGYTPFSLIKVCGWYLGNPLGLHYGEEFEPKEVPLTDPAFAGATGHIRVLSVLQAQELLEKTGFVAKVSSLGLLPIPEFMGCRLERLMPRRGHFLLMEAHKPARPGSPR